MLAAGPWVHKEQGGARISSGSTVIQGKHQRETGTLSHACSPPPSSSIPISPHKADPMQHLSAAILINTSLPLPSFLLFHFRKGCN